MMTVRFPNGQAVQYNNARWISRSSNCTDLYEKQNGMWIAQVPNSCIIENVRACEVYNPLTENDSTKIDFLTKEIRLLKRKILSVKLKSKK